MTNVNLYTMINLIRAVIQTWLLNVVYAIAIIRRIRVDLTLRLVRLKAIRFLTCLWLKNDIKYSRGKGQSFNCNDNTDGNNCEKCANNYFLNKTSGYCQKCDCDPNGVSLDASQSGSCNQVPNKWIFLKIIKCS